MLTDSELATIIAEIKPLASSRSVLHWASLLRLISHVERQAATIKRLETPVADGEVEECLRLLEQCADRSGTATALRNAAAPILRRQAREIERARASITEVVTWNNYIKEHGPDQNSDAYESLYAALDRLSALETREMKP